MSVTPIAPLGLLGTGPPLLFPPLPAPRASAARPPAPPSAGERKRFISPGCDA